MSPGIQKTPPSEEALGLFVAADPSSIRVAVKIRQLTLTSSSVLLRAEEGAGKSFVAWLLHEAGSRRDQPLVIVDCAGFSAEFLERDLFGNESSRSRFELAGLGTVVLDEVAALSMKLQAQLLRVLERSELERAGQRIPVNARVIATTKVDLERAIARRTLREDLYYRLSTTTLPIPALRDRPDDIPALSSHFLKQLAQVHHRAQSSLSEEASESLREFTFPGNVRQLKNVLEDMLLSSTGTRLDVDLLPNAVRPEEHRPMMTLEDLERSYIAEVLQRTGGTKSKAAEILGISRKTLLDKRKRYGLDRE